MACAYIHYGDLNLHISSLSRELYTPTLPHHVTHSLYLHRRALHYVTHIHVIHTYFTHTHVTHTHVIHTYVPTPTLPTPTLPTPTVPTHVTHIPHPMAHAFCSLTITTLALWQGCNKAIDDVIMANFGNKKGKGDTRGCARVSCFVGLMAPTKNLRPPTDTPCIGLRLEAFLIMPVQRMAQYALLLESLLKLTDKSRDDFLVVSAALGKLKAVAAKIDLATDGEGSKGK